MFGIGMPEMILILAVALIVIGPKKLPDLAKSLGKAMGEFKKATSDLKESMQIDTELKDVKTAFKDINKDNQTFTKTDHGQMNEKPVDATVPDDVPEAGKPEDDNGDPMDKLKATFDRKKTGALDSDAGALTGDDAPANGSDSDSETYKG
jgi:TatA/E family protein of Tat protein translocase